MKKMKKAILHAFKANQLIQFTPHLLPQVYELQIKPYEMIDADTGEIKSKYKYLEGHPRQYRFNAKTGTFNIGGTIELGDTLTLQPIAWRIFTDEILNMGRKNWAEIFFIDERKCLAAVLFHGYSVEELYRLIEPLYYDDLTLADVRLTVTVEKKENNNIKPKATYYIARFTYEIADTATVSELQAFASDHRIYRTETLSDVAEIRSEHQFYNPNLNGMNQNPEAILSGEKQQENTEKPQDNSEESQAA